jgi:hypothetical protein
VLELLGASWSLESDGSMVEFYGVGIFDNMIPLISEQASNHKFLRRNTILANSL